MAADTMVAGRLRSTKQLGVTQMRKVDLALTIAGFVLDLVVGQFVDFGD